MHKQIYLASNSPRRWELLQQLGLTLTRIHSDIDETPSVNESAYDYCLRIAIAKNQAAQKVRHQQILPEYPILTADTTVTIDGVILGKPQHQTEAIDMLKRLSGRTHQVLSAVCVSFNGQQFYSVQTSNVEFKSLTHNEIHHYVATGEPMDKAGAYGIQGLGGVFIRHLSGSFTGVMGLPIYETVELLKLCGIQLLKED